MLLANDDGIESPGLIALAKALGELGDVLVCAPERERSAASHAITLHKPLRAEPRQDGWFAISGTPVDCVYIGVLRLAKRKPDLVVSGINNGFNLGSDVFYSGTVAAAAEGALRGVPGLAVSQAPNGDVAAAAAFATSLARAMLSYRLPDRTVLNVNMPAEVPNRYRWTRLGERIYRDLAEDREDPRGRKYYWIGGPPVGVADVARSDGEALRDGLVSVTPLGLELTAYDLLDPAPDWPIDGYETDSDSEGTG